MSRILLVDDDDMALAILENVLRGAGYETDSAHDGQEALDMMESGDYRLVITDWEMPIMGGKELCRAIRSKADSAYVYVVLLTAHNSTQEKVEGLSAGADDFVAKPFNVDELLARVKTGERILTLDTRDVTIFALAKLVESRDPETGRHLERVQSYCRVLAQWLAGNGEFPDLIDAEFIRLLYKTSPLHDIGKVGISDRVLLKPDRLTAAEFEEMKAHPLIGAQTLQAALDRYPTTDFLQMARDIALTHHERFDGSGYPRGLRGEDIPLSGRIVALADVYDALTSKRVYKEAMSHMDAVGIIVAAAGTHFDPRVVEAFKACDAQFRAISERLTDIFVRTGPLDIPL